MEIKKGKTIFKHKVKSSSKHELQWKHSVQEPPPTAQTFDKLSYTEMRAHETVCTQHNFQNEEKGRYAVLKFLLIWNGLPLKSINMKPVLKMDVIFLLHYSHFFSLWLNPFLKYLIFRELSAELKATQGECVTHSTQPITVYTLTTVKKLALHQ